MASSIPAHAGIARSDVTMAPMAVVDLSEKFILSSQTFKNHFFLAAARSVPDAPFFLNYTQRNTAAA
jgi:hypothetical protein